MITLSPDQQVVFDQILEWLSSDRQRLTVGGLAGTGKSTLVSQLLEHPHVKNELIVEVCAFTGKAACVLRSKGVENARTLHSLIYQPQTTCKHCGDAVDPDEDRVVLKHCSTSFRRMEDLSAGLIVVDEASMLSRRLVDDLESYGKKVLYVGDHGQLEPIGDNPGLMLRPDLRLEKIHRQAEGSAIIRFAHALRSGRDPGQWVGYERHDVAIGVHESLSHPENYDVVLCGFNRTRVEINDAIRDKRGFKDDLPEPGEMVICLQNSREHAVFNGQRFEVLGRREGKFGPELDLKDELGNERPSTPIEVDGFGRAKADPTRRRNVLLDFGYAITTHRAQGSQWSKVAVYEELHPSWTASRWRYTATTRASEKLHYYV